MLGDPASAQGADVNSAAGCRRAQNTAHQVRADSRQRYDDEGVRHRNLGIQGSGEQYEHLRGRLQAEPFIKTV
jgi:hypothetical protein